MKEIDDTGFNNFHTALVSDWIVNDEKLISHLNLMAKDVWKNIDPSANPSENALAVLSKSLSEWFDRTLSVRTLLSNWPLESLLLSIQTYIFWPDIAGGLLFYLNDIGDIAGYVHPNT